MERKHTVLAGIILVPLFVGLFVSLRRPASAEQIANDYRDYLFSGNASGIRDLSASSEFRDNKITDENLREFLVSWVHPRFKGEVVPSEGTVVGDGSDGHQIFTWPVRTNHGIVPLSVTVAKTDEGLKVVNGLSSLVITAAALGDDYKRPTGLEKLRRWSENAREFAPKLAQYGLTMIRTTPENDPMTVEQFADWSATRYASASGSAPIQ
jgi:hypothetical protein